MRAMKEINPRIMAAYALRRRNIPEGTEVSIKTEGKGWPYPGGRFFVEKEYPFHIRLKVLTRINNTYMISVHKADLYTGRVELKGKDGEVYG